jgi:predicted secreted hydrolase
LVAVFLPFVAMTGAHGEEGWFTPVTPGRTLVYPRDNGAHPDFATEWWYFTGHLTAVKSAPEEPTRSYGFELTFFRVGVNPPALERREQSPWRIGSVYLSHFAITDDTKNRFFHYERGSRGALAEAGASESGFEVWLRDWRVRETPDGIELVAAEGGSELFLKLQSKKPRVLHGENGFSQKGSEHGQASYYSSFTRLVGEGRLRLPGEAEERVTAQAWMDQEFTSSSIARGTVGWDWFSLQFESGEELMLYHLRGEAGEPSQFSSGTFVTKEGTTHHLTLQEFTITPLKRWTSSKTGITYPAQWRIAVPRFGVAVELTPTVAEQELRTGSTTGLTYWEGRCLAKGSHPGVGYVELVGYKPES